MKYIIGLLLIFVNHSISFGQKFNTDAINKFWQVVDLLKADEPLDDSLWYSYYNLEGNKTYMENNRSENQINEHRKYLEFVFRPSFSDSLILEQKKKETSDDDILRNLIYIKQNEAKLRAFTRVITSPAYLTICVNLAKKYLPKNKFNAIPKDETIYINAMAFDAAVQDQNMYFGLSIVYEFDKFQKGTVAAHEFHHLLRIDKEIQKAVSSADSATFSIVTQINNEGCADLIDKTIVLANETKIYEGQEIMEWLMNDAETIIKQLDSSFIINATSTTKYVTRKEFRKMTNYSSGHIPGFYMVNIIKRNGYEQELINNCDNPFNFFYLYNKVAAKDNKKPTLFSDETINYLKQLEKRVW